MSHTVTLLELVSSLKSIVKCGIDEVGRGCLAGPVVAAAAILPGNVPEGLQDSKTLSEKRRHALEEALDACGALWATGWVSPEDIDALNIHHASLLAMRRAYARLIGTLVRKEVPLPSHALVDGIFPPDLPVSIACVVAGDKHVPCIQAASIVAKNARDAYMKVLDRQFPQYGFSRNKGYPTLSHRRAILRYGPCEMHRRSFRLYGNQK